MAAPLPDTVKFHLAALPAARRAAALPRDRPGRRAPAQPTSRRHPGLKVTRAPVVAATRPTRSSRFRRSRVSQARSISPARSRRSTAPWPGWSRTGPGSSYAVRDPVDVVGASPLARPRAAWRDRARRRLHGARRARRAPLWRALIELELAAEEHDGDDEEACEAEAQRLVAALTPPDWIAVKADLLLEVYRSTGPRDGDFDPARVPADVGPWAAAMAERLTEQHAPGAPASERGGHSEPPYPLTWMVFLGLVRGGVSVEPRWDWLCPVAGGALEAASDECLGALPAARRDAAIVRGLAAMFPRDALRTGAAMLARYPSLALVDHLIARAATAHGSLLCPPRRAYLPGLAAALAAHPALVAHLDAHLATLPALPVLRMRSARYIHTVDELTPGQRTMLAVLGQGWEGDDGPLVSEGDDGTPVFGALDYVSAFEIEDGAGDSAFEALLYMDEDGAVCVTDTTNSVMYASQMSLSCNRGDELHEALHAVLRQRPPRAD
jgi:hypothetical protein